VEGQTHTVTQDPPCRYSIEPDSRNFSSDGGTGTIGVTAGDGCEWNASSNRTWIRITSGGSGSGDGTVRYTVDRYTGTTVRRGTITVEDLTHTVTQEPGPRHEITNIDMTPSSPASLAFNERVNISFDYYTDEADGVRIWATPWTNGERTPNSRYQGSAVLPAGDGSASRYFYVTSSPVTVDQVRFRMTNVDQSEVLVEFYVNVSYAYGAIDVTGTWSHWYDWGCDGSSSSTTWYINSDNTFANGEGSSGTWTLDGNEITLIFSSGTTYTGTVNGDYMEGTMVSFSGSTGCWGSSR
jgi:hypothetical protein